MRNWASFFLRIIGILLILLGIAALILPLFTFSSSEPLFEIGNLQATTEIQKQIAISPIVGIVVLAGGIILTVIGFLWKKSK